MGNYYMLDGALPLYSNAVCLTILTQLTAVQYILCDIICVWRTVVLWNKDKRVIVILVLSNLGATGT